jgi:hypothetical protein
VVIVFVFFHRGSCQAPAIQDVAGTVLWSSGYPEWRVDVCLLPGLGMSTTAESSREDCDAPSSKRRLANTTGHQLCSEYIANPVLNNRPIKNLGG